MSMFDLTNKIALVTGAGTGLGKAIAIELSRWGADVVVAYRSSRTEADQVVKAIEEQGNRAIAVQGDVTDEGQVIHLVEQAQLFGNGHIDILVNNAGIIMGSYFIKDTTRDVWDKTFATNMTSTFLMCKHVIPIMEQQGYGRIINMSSVAAHNGGGKGTIPYAATKAAIQAFTKGLAKETAPNILVNCVAPGIISTKIHQAYIDEAGRKKNLARIPLGREGKPIDIAGAVVYLVSEYAKYITGETIEVNGGIYMD